MFWTYLFNILKGFTLSTSLCIIEGIPLILSKNTKSAFDTVVTKLAIMLLVLIVTLTEPDLSPITATRAAKLNLGQVKNC